jgi:hypothetical protein
VTAVTKLFLTIPATRKLNCERHIADLTLRIGSDVLASAEFIDFLQQPLDGWEERKKSLAEL